MQQHGTKHWGVIGAQLNGRTGKQCRERWHNQLDPAIRKDPWTREEEDILLRAHAVVSGPFFVSRYCAQDEVFRVENSKQSFAPGMKFLTLHSKSSVNIHDA